MYTNLIIALAARVPPTRFATPISTMPISTPPKAFPNGGAKTRRDAELEEFLEARHAPCKPIHPKTQRARACASASDALSYKLIFFSITAYAGRMPSMRVNQYATQKAVPKVLRREADADADAEADAKALYMPPRLKSPTTISRPSRQIPGPGLVAAGLRRREA